jgi:hypothetical protein
MNVTFLYALHEHDYRRPADARCGACITPLKHRSEMLSHSGGLQGRADDERAPGRIDGQVAPADAGTEIPCG